MISQIRNRAVIDNTKISVALFSDNETLAAGLSKAGYAIGGENSVLAVLDLRTHDDRQAKRLKAMVAAPSLILAIIGETSQKTLDLAAQCAATHILAAPFDDAVLDAQLRAMGTLLQHSEQSGETDSLTGLKTADHARQILHRWLDEEDREVTGCLCGLRRFESINAAFGKAYGDALLQNIARNIREFVASSIGSDAVLTRFGGSEFLIMTCAPVNRRKWQVVATELMEIMSQPFTVGTEVIRLTARISLAKSGENENSQSYIERLTAALGDVHRQNAQRIKWSDRISDAVPESGFQLESDLLRSIERGEIAISLQPQFSVMTGQLVGAEALARWEHEEFGIIGAATLFALAERTDFTEHLSAHIGKLAMQCAAAWPASLSFLRLSLNVTAQELASSRFVENQESALAHTGFDRSRLTLEITESALISNLQGAAQVLGMLRDTGIRIAIDDFGTGYSNFLYLKSLPLDYLKLDQAMTRDIASGPRDLVIVRSIIALGHSLGLDIIAEGVESQDQLDVLKAEGCQFYQGFLRAKSLSPGDFEKFALRSN